jgi:hypothetical protein
MARQRVNPPTPPTLPPERAIPLLEKHVIEAEKLRSEPYDSPERDQWENTSEGALIAGLGQGNPTVGAFGAAQSSFSSIYDRPEQRLRQANERLDRMIAVLRSAIEQLRWTLPDPAQVFLSAGSPHDAYVEIRRVTAQVTKEVMIVDGWVDQTLWPLLSNLPSTAKIRILTDHMKGDFALEGRKFAAQHGNQIEVRTNSSYHDRFIFIHGGKCWHLGASIKDAGTKAFAMSEFDDRNFDYAGCGDDVEHLDRGESLAAIVNGPVGKYCDI